MINEKSAHSAGMSLPEIKVVGAILFVIVAFSLWNFRLANIRARDIQRKNDLKHIKTALDNYAKEVGLLPVSRDNKILACDPRVISQESSPSGNQEIEFKPCDWGLDKIVNPYTEAAFIDGLPIDPLSSQGRTYIYLSNGRNYQLLASLEQKNEAEYNKGVAQRNLLCGDKTCNFAVASSNNLPLDKSIEEIEQERSSSP